MCESRCNIVAAINLRSREHAPAVVYIGGRHASERGESRQKCLCRCLRAHTSTVRQLHSARRSALFIPESTASLLFVFPGPRPIYIPSLPVPPDDPSSLLPYPPPAPENFDTRDAGRSLARSKLHPLRARHFNTSPSCPRRAWPRIPLLISREEGVTS